MENTIKKLTKEELTNLTKEQLEELKVSYAETLKEVYDKCKQHSNDLQEIISKWLNQFDIKCKVQYFNIDNRIWSYELDKHPDSTYKVSFDVKLLDENNEVKFYNSFSLKVYDNSLTGSISGSSDASRNEDVYDYYTYILFAKVLENDYDLCKLVNVHIDNELLENNAILENNISKIDSEIARIEREEHAKQYELDKANALEQLTNGKFYKYHDEKRRYNNTKYYTIDKVGEKTVAMTEISINAWNERGYSIYGTHRFKLEGDVFYEMLIANTGFVLDNIDDEIEQARKAKKEYDRI